MFNKLFKKTKCEHDYKYFGKDIPDSHYQSIEKKEYYIFKCSKCEKTISICNYVVIEEISNIFIKLINNEMSKNNAERLSNREFMDKVWNSYSDNPYLNNAIRRLVNVMPISLDYGEIRNLSDKNILSLGFRINTSEIHKHILYDKLEERIEYVMARSVGGLLTPINIRRLKVDIDNEIKTLKSNYLRAGIKVEHEKLAKETAINICRKYNILYTEHIVKAIG